jgi:predicted transport protein
VSDIQLFRVSDSAVIELEGTAAPLEKTLQKLVENHMVQFLGVRFLATEHPTGKTHGGRIDSLGIDENECPVIIEYKRHSHQNVMNQGLFYLDWLLDHKADFRWLVMEKLGKEHADAIEWKGTRLLCIAEDFSKYDVHAVQQIPRNIELIRYKFFGSELILLELVNVQTVQEVQVSSKPAKPPITLVEEIQAPKTSLEATGKDKPLSERLEASTPAVRALFDEMKSLLVSLGDDVQERELKLYTAFRRLKNFACMFLGPNDSVILTLKVDPDSVTLEEGFTRDVRAVGHWGTGDLMVYLRTPADVERAQPLVVRAYQES